MDERYEPVTYERPVIEDHGDLTELTAGHATGTQLDADFPRGTPNTQLTFSTP